MENVSLLCSSGFFEKKWKIINHLIFSGNTIRIISTKNIKDMQWNDKKNNWESDNDYPGSAW